MNRKIAAMCHLAFWAFLFFSPLTFWRGFGITLPHYLMICMQPVATLVVFYLNYLYLAPKLFVPGKHRYDLLINTVLVLVLVISLHHWMNFTNEIFIPQFKVNYDLVGTLSYILRDSLNLAIFAGGATALALARRWVTTDQKLKEIEAARVQTELSNLRNQINPHFLLNTLNNIYALTAFDAPKAQQAIQELAKMLRHILYDYQQPTVSLKDEIEFLQNYVSLMRIRLPQSVDVTFDVQCPKTDIEIAPMLFISLVENAFKHGISSTEPSFVHITISADNKQVVCDISNSNCPKSDSDNSGHGVGLQQVQRGLDLSYPGRYQWERGTTEDQKIYHSKITIYP